MLLGITILLATIACIALLFSAQIGVLAIYLARPFVDTAWSHMIFMGFRLTELVSVLVPLITFLLILFNLDTKKSVTKMPFYTFWMVYLAYILFFSVSIAVNSSIGEGASVFFRFVNGFVGFYLVQAYFRQEKEIKLFFFILALAGIFPVATGLYETIKGVHWTVTTAEGEIRSIGLYHDAITIRYYGLQTVLAIAACLAFKFPENFALRLGLVGLLLGSMVVVFKALSKAGLLTLASWSVIWSVGRKNWVLPAIVFVAAIFLIPLYFQEISDTVYNLFHKEVGAINGKVATNRTFAGRWGIWAEMSKEWSDFSMLQKLFGSGKSAFGAHNDYLQMAFHGGIIGLILYVSFLLTIVWKLVAIYLKSGHLLSVLALMAFVMWIVDSIGLVPSLYTGYQWFVWGVIGLCLRHHSDQEKKTKRIAKLKMRDKKSALQQPKLIYPFR